MYGSTSPLRAELSAMYGPSCPLRAELSTGRVVHGPSCPGTMRTPPLPIRRNFHIDVLTGVVFWQVTFYWHLVASSWSRMRPPFCIVLVVPWSLFVRTWSWFLVQLYKFCSFGVCTCVFILYATWQMDIPCVLQKCGPWIRIVGRQDRRDGGAICWCSGS